MILIWDTCALNSVCRAIAFHIKRTVAPHVVPTSQGNEFLGTLRDIMTELETRCGFFSHTSESVFALEIDPELADSKLRNQDELLDSFCDQESFAPAWCVVLEDRISPVAVAEEEIGDLRPAIQPDPGQQDISLIVAALRLTTETGQKCILVTDDNPLSDRINQLKRDRKQVFLNGQQHSTALVTAMLSLQLLRELYVSCGADHEFWRSAMFSYCNHYGGDVVPPGQNQLQSVIQFLKNSFNDRQEKDSRAAAQEYRSIFGAENG